MAAAGVVPAAQGAAFAFLVDLRNHWGLTDRWVRVSDLTGPASGPTGGWVELHGPLGIRRRVRTTMVDADPPRRMSGLAEVMPHTRAQIAWSLEPVGAAATRVRLEATMLACGRLDRVLLSLGGRRWLEDRFTVAVGRLGERLADDPPARRDPATVSPLQPEPLRPSS